MKYDKKTLLPLEKEYLEKILKKVSEYSGIDIELLRGTARVNESVATARQIYFYSAMKLKLFEIPLGKIGSIVDKDHATVKHGIKKIQDAIDIKYMPILDILYKLKISMSVYNEYKLIWENLKLTDCIKNGIYLTDEIVLEYTKQF